MNESQAIEVMGALSHEIRLRIIRHLVMCGASGEAAGVIGGVVNAAPSKVTFHISILQRAGLVESTRVSRKIIYRINIEKIGAVISYLLTDCCKNDPAVLSCCLTDQSSC